MTAPDAGSECIVRSGWGGLRTSMPPHERLSKNRISIVVATAAACAPAGAGKNGATSTAPDCARGHDEDDDVHGGVRARRAHEEHGGEPRRDARGAVALTRRWSRSRPRASPPGLGVGRRRDPRRSRTTRWRRAAARPRGRRPRTRASRSRPAAPASTAASRRACAASWAWAAPAPSRTPRGSPSREQRPRGRRPGGGEGWCA